MELLGIIGNYRELQGIIGNYVFVEYCDGLLRVIDVVNSGDVINVVVCCNVWCSEGGMDVVCWRGGVGMGVVLCVEVSVIVLEINEGED